MALPRRVKHIMPILSWLPQYEWRRDFRFDFVAGITVAMMLIPQEVSLAGIMQVPPQYGLYTAAVTPLIYAMFGSSTVLSVANGAQVSLLVGAALQPIEDLQERVATGILITFVAGVILLLVRALGLSALADFFSRPVMGGFVSAGGLIIMQSQIPTWLSIKTRYTPYPPISMMRIIERAEDAEINGVIVGIVSIVLLISLRMIKQRVFRHATLKELFQSDQQANAPEHIRADDTRVTATPAPFHYQYTPPPESQCHGFSLTDELYVSMEANSRAPTTMFALTDEGVIQSDRDENKEQNTPNPNPRHSTSWLLMYFAGRTLCDLGPLLVCVGGAIVGYFLGPERIRVTGEVPGGFPSPVEPWYGLYDLIDLDKVGGIIGDAFTIVAVLYISSTAIAKRLAIQRGEDIIAERELIGLGLANIVGSFFRAMPATGGMSRTAVNLQNAKTQLASIITTSITIMALYMPPETLYFIPRASLASIIIVAGSSLVEIQEAKWLFQVRRDEFYVWLASFVLTLTLGVVQGLVASIVSSVIALMYKTKRPPVVFLAELDNGSLVDRDLFPMASRIPDAVVLRVSGSLYFANCARIVAVVEREMGQVQQHSTGKLCGVVLDALHVNDMDTTSIQVLADFHEKLAARHLLLAISNANARVKQLLQATNLMEKVVANDASISTENALEQMRQECTVDSISH